jgi:hypothetical protein
MNKYLRFDNLHDFWSCAFRESTAYIKSSRKASSDWYGGAGWQEAKNLAICGWTDVLEEISKIRVNLLETITGKMEIRLPEYGIAGGVIDVGEYLCGSPEYFIKSVPAEYENQGKIIRVVCSIACSADISPEVIIKKGAVICALIDALEMLGYRCKVIANSTCSFYSSRFEVDVCIKKANQTLNMAETVFCLAHPAMFRRMMFSVKEQEGWSDYAYAYGYPAEAKDKGDLYINKIFSREVVNSKAIEWVISQLKKLGVTINYN